MLRIQFRLIQNIVFSFFYKIWESWLNQIDYYFRRLLKMVKESVFHKSRNLKKNIVF